MFRVYSYIDGNEWESGLDLESICDFSSEGPLRNLAQKSDVTAPGAWIAAPLSADTTTVRREYVVSLRYMVLPGTSMATPFITGIVALLLEGNGTLDPSQVKSILRSNSIIPGKPAGAFDPKWGYGSINADGL